METGQRKTQELTKTTLAWPCTSLSMFDDRNPEEITKKRTMEKSRSCGKGKTHKKKKNKKNYTYRYVMEKNIIVILTFS